jgi:hypothetical protein
MIRRPTLIDRQAAFLNTFSLLSGEIAPKWLEEWRAPPQLVYFQGGSAEQIIPMQGSDIIAALINASAALVVGADLRVNGGGAGGYSVGYGNYCDDCGRNDGTHDPEVEH